MTESEYDLFDRSIREREQELHRELYFYQQKRIELAKKWKSIEKNQMGLYEFDTLYKREAFVQAEVLV